MDNLEEMNNFPETYRPPKLNQEEIDNLSRQSLEVKLNLKQRKQTIKKKPPYKQKSRTRWLHRQILPKKEEIIPILLKLFQKTEEEGTLPKTFYEATIILI